MQWLGLGSVALSVMLIASSAYPHSWYPQNCCSQTDCRPVPCYEIEEIAGGWWQYLPTQQKFPPHGVHPSQDRFCHVCINVNVTQGYCVFIQNSF